MATTTDTGQTTWDDINFGLELDLSDDSESLASLETDDGQDHPPERILAEHPQRPGFVWYLVKWKGCPILRSSWERASFFEDCRRLLTEWEIRKKEEELGIRPKFDLEKYHQGIRDLERLDHHRRSLRRLKRRVVRVKQIVEAA